MKPWSKYTRREKTLVVITMLALVVTAVYHLALRDVITRWDTLSREIQVKEQLYARKLALIENADKINSVYESMSKDFEIREDDQLVASRVLQRIESLAGPGVELHNVKPLEEILRDNSRIYEFEIDGKAPKENLAKFVRNLQYEDKTLRIRSLNLSSTNKGDELRYHMVVSKLQIYSAN
jgi:hypothetical protein